MGIEDAFLHEILAHPDDDAPRLIYADWLDEHNDPRGEFIRIQCALAQLSDEDPRRWPLELRQQELLREHEEKWLPKGVHHVKCAFQRGFVEEITLSPETFLKEADRLFEQAPIRKLKLHRRGWERVEVPDVSLAQVAPSHHLARLQSLSLIDRSLSRRDLHEFLASPTLGQLTELELSHLVVESEASPRSGPHALPAEIISDLSELPRQANLTALHLTDTGLTLDALRILTSASAFESLRELNLSGNTLTHGAAEILGESRLLGQLEILNIDSIFLGDAGALIVADWPELPRLTRLSLRHNRIFSSAIQALAEAPALQGLLSLDLFGNIACDVGAIALASSSWTGLQALNLRFNGVGDKGVHALARSETLSHLTWLNVTANRISSTGADSLIQSSTLPRLARLDLLRNDIGTEEQQRLRDRFGPFVHFWPLAD